MRATDAQRDAYPSVIASILNACNFQSYLELGIGYGVCLQYVSAACPGVKITAVDLRPLPGYENGITQGRVEWRLGETTDQFFSKTTSKFDAIFIDADHDSAQVLIDFNNAIEHLSPDGIIFLHDTYPPNQEYTAPNRCSDSFVAYLHLKTLSNLELVNLPSFCGLTIVRPLIKNQPILTLPLSVQG